MEWGSVQTKFASINLTLGKFFNLFKQRAINSLDSKVHVTQYAGGFKYLKVLEYHFHFKEIKIEYWLVISQIYRK